MASLPPSDATASDILFWCDVETTGLNPESESLLQVAALVTDLQGNELCEPFERVIRHSQEEATALREASVAFVKAMHDSTGLWARLPQGTPREQVDQELFAYIAFQAPQARQARLAGNSIRLDLNFLEKYLPQSYGHLHYRSLDVTALSYLLMAEGIASHGFPKRKTHDAVEDIRESLEEYKWVRSLLAPLTGK